jgi:hypothetical protein
MLKKNYSEIDNEFEKSRNKKTGTDIYWYKLLGIDSISKLAASVSRLPEYFIFYSRGSELAHTTSYQDQFKFKNGKIEFEPIRHLQEMNPLLQGAMIVCIHTYIAIIEHYRKGERGDFVTKYKNDWRKAFQNIPIVTYKEKVEK